MYRSRDVAPPQRPSPRREHGLCQGRSKPTWSRVAGKSQVNLPQFDSKQTFSPPCGGAWSSTLMERDSSSPRTRILPRPKSAPRNPHPRTMLHETRSMKLRSFIWVVPRKVTYLLDVRRDSSRLRFSWIVTYKTLNASFWPGLSDSSPETVSSCCNFARSWVES